VWSAATGKVGEGRLVFQGEGDGEVVPVAVPQPKIAAQAARATGGRGVEVPSIAAARGTEAILTS